MAYAQDLSLIPSRFHRAPFVGMRQSIPSLVPIVSPLVDRLMSFISKYRSADENSVEIQVALQEALVNAIVHGNLEDPGKVFTSNCRCSTDGDVSITIEDEGHGFDDGAVPDPTSPDNLLRTHGREVYLMKTLMDEVDFEQGGSVVRLRERANTGSDTKRKSQ